MSRRARGALVVVSTLAALAGLASCTGASTGRASAQPAQTVGPPSARDLSSVVAAARASLATTALVTIRLEPPPVFGSNPKPIAGRGSFDFASDLGQADLNQLTGTERLIYVPQAVFVSQPGRNALLPAGKSWISAGLNEQSQATGFPQFVTQAEALNPGVLLSEIRLGAISAAPTTNAGANGDHGYLVEVDLTRARSQAGGQGTNPLREIIGYQLTELSGAAVPPPITIQVSIDNHGRVDQLQTSPASAGTITISLSRFGNPVTVNSPARNQIVDIASIAPGGEHEIAGGIDSDGA